MWIWVGAKLISAATPKAHAGPFKRQAKTVESSSVRMLKNEATFLQGRERFGAEDLMPKIGGENVEKAHRREDRTGQRSLNFDVMIDDRPDTKSGLRR